jgi:hypothetical protein
VLLWAGFLCNYLHKVIYAVGIHQIFIPNATEIISYPSLDFSLSIFSTSRFKVLVDHIDDAEIIE